MQQNKSINIQYDIQMPASKVSLTPFSSLLSILSSTHTFTALSTRPAQGASAIVAFAIGNTSAASTADIRLIALMRA